MKKIIVVDDDQTNVSLLKMLLELDGFAVEACTSIEQAEQASGNGVSAFVVDVNLSRGTSGIDLLRHVRAGETAAPTNTIVIMTSGDHRRQSECQSAGADQFLLKPYPPNALSGYINTLLSKR
ncbi:MAG: response regulator [Ardenticatenaceae bacterium]|nr:response regulator [Ardenticatenaceae bacterium]